MEKSNNKSIGFKLVVIWIAIVFLVSFLLTITGSSDPVNIVVLPEVPRQDQPIVATVKLNNESSLPSVIRYHFFANGELIMDGTTEVSPYSSKMYQYAYRNPINIGEQVHFIVRTQSETGNHEEIISSPPYPPQVFSSFISFASFSTSVMSSMITMTYYNNTFGKNIGLNLGIVFTVVLMCLLIFLELSSTTSTMDSTAIISRLRINMNTVTWIVFIIFIGIVYTTTLVILRM
ncbi:hypothetical protein ACFLVC_02860 [Chloroflexota bacterium]